MEERVQLQRCFQFLEKVNSVHELKETKYLDGRVKNIPEGVAYEIGKGIAAKLNEFEQKYFLLSGDGRASTPMILEEMTAALTQSNICVVYCGYNNTTPMFDTEREKLKISGLNVTASHQAPEYNGFKLVFESTPKSDPELEGIPKRKSNEKVYEAQSALRQDYLISVEDIVNKFSVSTDVKILYDAMQGVSYPFFEHIAKKKGINFGSVREYPNAYFHLTAGGPDPSKQENFDILESLADLSKYDVVLNIDGDGDRFGAGTSNGLILPPILIALRAEYLGKWNGNKGIFVAEHCIATIIEKYLERIGVATKRVNRGRTKIIQEIKKTENVIGGAEYGLHNYLSTGIDDALVNSFEFIAVLSSLKENGNSLDRKLEEITEGVRAFKPELRVDYNISRKRLVDEIKNATKYFGKLKEDDGIIFEDDNLFWNIRTSSNEDSLTLNVNGSNQSNVKTTYKALCDMLKKIDPSLKI